uniref:Ig-like domain-containing protein n=1 Tax=Amphilophus citrinellus TaxID=61819 RepID=A0A3Q0RLL4_AMPCI
WLLLICLSSTACLFVSEVSALLITHLKTGQSVSIRCKSSTLIGDDINWYLQKSGEAPKLLIYDTTIHQSGVLDRFRATAVQTDFTLIFSGVQAEDAGVYYCQQHNSFPFIQ